MTEEKIKEYLSKLSNYNTNADQGETLKLIKKLLSHLDGEFTDEIKNVIFAFLFKCKSTDLMKKVMRLPSISRVAHGCVSLLEDVSDEGLLKAIMLGIKPANIEYESEETILKVKDSIERCFGGKPNKLFLFLLENRSSLDADLKELLIENLISQRPLTEKLVVHGVMPFKLSFSKRMDFAGKRYKYGKVERNILKSKAKTSQDKFKVFVALTGVDDLIAYYREHDLEMTIDKKRLLFQKVISQREDFVEELIERHESYNIITDSMSPKMREKVEKENVIKIDHLKDLSIDEAQRMPNVRFIGIKSRK